ncbi:MAG: hypothetical protein ACM30G_12605 [Micromonosporaceae bacterium]
MTSRISRILIISTAAIVAATGLGCGFISQAKGVLEAAKVLGDFADRLEKHSRLTYTAEYQVTGGEKVTLVQQPPNATYLGKSGQLIVTADAYYLCDASTKVCHKTPHTATATATGADPAQAGLVAGIAGQGFVTPELALGLVAAAALVPGAKVDQSNKTIAGQKSLCANVTGLEKAASTPGQPDALKDFSVCVTDAGVLASFDGTLANGRQGGIMLTSYSDRVDAAAFQPPAGYTVTDATTPS